MLWTWVLECSGQCLQWACAPECVITIPAMNMHFWCLDKQFLLWTCFPTISETNLYSSWVWDKQCLLWICIPDNHLLLCDSSCCYEPDLYFIGVIFIAGKLFLFHIFILAIKVMHKIYIYIHLSFYWGYNFLTTC